MMVISFDIPEAVHAQIIAAYGSAEKARSGIIAAVKRDVQMRLQGRASQQIAAQIGQLATAVQIVTEQPEI